LECEAAEVADSEAAAAVLERDDDEEDNEDVVDGSLLEAALVEVGSELDNELVLVANVLLSLAVLAVLGVVKIESSPLGSADVDTGSALVV